jgi:SAM-dependent methyltransferase
MTIEPDEPDDLAPSPAVAADAAATAASGRAPSTELVEALLDHYGTRTDLAGPPVPDTPYSRRPLFRRDDLEIMIARWAPGERCAPHDHGGSGGFVVALDGRFEERRFAWSGDRLVAGASLARTAGRAFGFGPPVIHDMVAPDGGVTLHLYSPAPSRMAVFDLDRSEILDLVGDFGAWIPPGEHRRIAFADRDPSTHDGLPPAAAEAPGDRRPVVWIGYTTEYRGGSAEFAVAAATLGRERTRAVGDDAEVRVVALTHKAEFRDAMAALAAGGRVVRELHVVGHAGMYGPMFGSVAWPEQFSPHEWRTMTIPFAADGEAWFRACRTARWFAPFFARTFGVTAHGNQNYTTVSARPDRFAWAGRTPTDRRDLYLVATPGKRSHGLSGSFRKYLGAPVEPMIACRPEVTDRSYDKVADLYDRAYVDIRVREAEWAWITDRVDGLRRELGRPLRVAEVGCGNGAMLRALDDRGDLEVGLGLDASVGMIGRARDRSGERDRLRFETIDGPSIPAPDGDLDVVVSFLSFRYLDWDPLLAEVRRVLAPGGRLWVVDMVEKPVGVRDLPLLARSWVHHRRVPSRHPQFAVDLQALTSHPDWKAMVGHNPIRAEHEYRWFLESRFAPARLEVLTTTARQRVVAFDSGPISAEVIEPLSYP